jgi:competence protein ComEC
LPAGLLAVAVALIAWIPALRRAPRRMRGPLTRATDVIILGVALLLGFARGAHDGALGMAERRLAATVEGTAFVRLVEDGSTTGCLRARVDAIRPLGEMELRPLARGPHLLIPARMRAEAEGAFKRARAWEGFARIEIPRPAACPGDFDGRAYVALHDAAGWIVPHLLRRALPATMCAHPRPGLEQLPEAWGRAIGCARLFLARRLDRALAPAHADFARLFLLGRGALEPDMDESAAWVPLQRAGAAHLLAVSGLHVAFLIALLRACLLPLPIARRARALVLGLALLCFGSLAAWSPSVTRAVCAGMLWAVLYAAGRRAGAVTILVLVLAAMLWVNPASWHDLGVQLSYGVSFALIGAARGSRPSEAAHHGRHARAWLTVQLMLAAQTTSWPAILAAQGSASPIYLASNAVLVPFSGLLLPAILLTLTFAGLPGFPADLAGGPTDVLIGAFLSVSRLFARGADALPVGGTLSGTAGLAGTLFLAVLWHLPRMRRVIRATLAAVACVALTLLAGRALPAPSIHMLDVGQGESWAIFWPRETWVIDVGPASSRPEQTAMRLARVLRAHGRCRIDRLFLTHDDSDHSGALSGIFSQGVGVREIHPPRGWAPTPRTRAWIREATARGARVSPLARGDTLRCEGAWAALLHPSPEPGSGERNACGLGLRIQTRALSLVIPGDAPAEVLDEWAAAGLIAPSSIIAAGHHGSAGSTPEAFLACAEPEVVCISVGRGNRFGHPARAVLARAHAAGATVFRTDEDGMISIVPAPDGGTVSGYGSQRRFRLRSRAVDGRESLASP